MKLRFKILIFIIISLSLIGTGAYIISIYNQKAPEPLVLKDKVKDIISKKETPELTVEQKENIEYNDDGSFVYDDPDNKVIYDEESDDSYVNNILILLVNKDISKDDVDKIADVVNGNVVGFIKSTLEDDDFVDVDFDQNNANYIFNKPIKKSDLVGDITTIQVLVEPSNLIQLYKLADKYNNHKDIVVSMPEVYSPSREIQDLGE